MTEHSRVMKNNGSQHKKNQIRLQKWKFWWLFCFNAYKSLYLKKPFYSWHHPLFMTEHGRVMKNNGSQHKKNRICRQKWKGTALFSSRGTIGSYDVTGLCQAVIGRHLPMLVCDWPKFATHKVRPMRDQEASLAAWPTTTTHTDQHKICQIICWKKSLIKEPISYDFILLW